MCILKMLGIRYQALGSLTRQSPVQPWAALYGLKHESNSHLYLGLFQQLKWYPNLFNRTLFLLER